MNRADSFKKQLIKFTKDEPFNAIVNDAYNIRAYIKDVSVATGDTTLFIYTKDTLCRRGDILKKDGRRYLVTHVKYVESKGFDSIAATLMEEEFYINTLDGIYAIPYLSSISSTVGVIGTYMANSESQATIQVSSRHPNFSSLVIDQEIFIGSLKYKIGFIDNSVEGISTLITTKKLWALGDDSNIGVVNRAGNETVFPIWKTAIAQGPYISIDKPLALTPVTAEDSQLADVNYRYISDRPEVAVVDKNGTVTPVGEGAAMIKVASLDDNNIPLDWAETRIVTQLIPMNPGKVISIMDNHKFIDLAQEFTIICRTTNSEDVIVSDSYEYSPSDNTVCSVDEYGVVTSLAEGVSEITVTSKRFPSISTIVTITVALEENFTWEVLVSAGNVNTISLTGSNKKTWTIQKYRNGLPVDSGTFTFKVTGETSGFSEFARVAPNAFEIKGTTLSKTINVACTNAAEPYSVNITITTVFQD